ncbi:TonB-dependent receptor [Denitratisoma sp. agr-D3]
MVRKKGACYAAASLATLTTLPGYCQWSDATGLDDLPVVLSASRLRQPLKDAPAAVTVVDRDMIKASGARALPDLLRLVPGFLVGQLNGNTASVTNQGLADAFSHQMQVLIDGRSIYSPLYSGVNWTDIPLAIADIERIEVVRGPNAVTYGANSFLGVINIITKEPGTEQGEHIEWVRGNEGVSELVYRHGGVDKGWRYRVTAVRNEDRGFPDLFDSQKTDKANLRAEYQVDTANQLQIQAGYAGGVRGQEDRDNKIIRNRTVNSAFAQLRWSRRNSADDEWWIQYFHEQRKAAEMTSITDGTTSVPVDYGMDTRRDDVEFQRINGISPSLRVSSGGQLRYDAARSPGFLGKNTWVDMGLWRLFSNLEWRVSENVVTNAGVMFEKTGLTVASVSPRLAVNWEFFPQHTVRVSWGRAERTPTLFEAKGNSSLSLNGILLKQLFFVPTIPRAEKNQTAEIAYLGEMPGWHLSGDVRVFKSEITSLLATTSIPFPGQLPSTAQTCDGVQCAQTFVNRDRLELSGTDFSLHWTPIPTTKIYYAGAFLWAASGTGNAQGLIAQTPSSTESILLDQKLFDQWQLGIGLYTVSAMKWAGGTQQTGYHKADIRLARTFSPAPGYKGELAWVVENASQPTMDFYGYVKPPRISTLRLSMDF